MVHSRMRAGDEVLIGRSRRLGTLAARPNAQPQLMMRIDKAELKALTIECEVTNTLAKRLTRIQTI
jgi:hypothetical protein